MARKWMAKAAPCLDREKLEADYRAAGVFENAAVGDVWLFWKQLLARYYLPLADLVWVYLRQEDSRVTLCCGKGILPSYYVVVVTRRGERIKLPVEQKAAAQGLVEAIKKSNPAVETGYYQALEERFFPVAQNKPAP